MLKAAKARLLRAKATSPGELARILTGGRELQGPHLDAIDQMFKDIADGTLDRGMITMPPRHGKSRRASRWGPLWYLLKFPDREVILASYSAELAADHGRWVRDTITESPELGIRLSESSQAANRFGLAGQEIDGAKIEGGGMFTAGVGGTMTGRGAHLLIIDDPFKNAQDADSPTIRFRVWEWWTSTVLTRLAPGGAVIVIQTRWHENDLAGRLLATERDQWRVIDMPAIAYLDPDEPDKVDALGRQPGEALWPTRYSVEALLKIKGRVGERVWNALYQQRPRPLEGGVFQWAWIMDNRITAMEVPQLVRVVVAVDPAGGEEANDETGIIAAGLDINRESYILADASAAMSSAAWGVAACRLALKVGADSFVYEKNYGGDMAATVLTSAWRELSLAGETQGRMMPAIKAVNARVGKRLRAEPIAQIYEQNRVHHVGEFPVYESQLTSWLPGMDSPDHMDAGVWALTELNEGYQHKSAPVPGIRDERLRGRR